MQLTLLPQIASNPQTYIRNVHLFYLHNTIPPTSYQAKHMDPSLLTPILEHALQDCTATIPGPLLTTIKNHFDTTPRSDVVSCFLNAHYLNLLPSPSPATPLTLQSRRWPMTPNTERTLKQLAREQSLPLTTFLATLSPPDPPPQPKLTFLPHRLVTTYMYAMTDNATINKFANYYDKSLLMASTTPRTNLAKAGAALDYIYDTNSKETH